MSRISRHMRLEQGVETVVRMIYHCVTVGDVVHVAWAVVSEFNEFRGAFHVRRGVARLCLAK